MIEFKRWATGGSPAGLRLDLVITLICAAFWLWFAWQHGYLNSPDSWYRGILGKSIVDGHPYWINLKQGWLYDFEAWHHDAAHPPLLPALYALSFALIGPYISVANVVSSLATGLAVLPLLRLSRAITGGMLAGLIAYAWVVFSATNDLLFEVFSGLSIPSTMLILAVALHAFWLVVVRYERRYITWCALAMAAYFYVRPGEQLIVYGLMVTSLALGAWMLPRPAVRRLCWMWGYTLVLVLPWSLRNLVLFGSPFFTHMTPMMWTDRSYDYWTYHETIPLPTPAAYFADHTFRDFVEKIATTFSHSIDMFNQAVDGLLLSYAFLLIAAAVAAFGVRSRRKRYLLAVIAIVLTGYVVLHGLVPVIDTRYMVLPMFCVVVLAVFALFTPWRRFVAVRWLGVAGVGALFFVSQSVFWEYGFPKELNFEHKNSDQRLSEDTQVQALRAKFGPDDVMTAPISDVQRLNFATGITFVEAPDNIDKLVDPVAFFKRYGIRYSLMDVTRILPDSRIEEIELVGGRPLFRIRLDDNAVAAAENVTPIARQARPSDRVYVDAYHGGSLPSESALTDAQLRVATFDGALAKNADALMQSRLYVVRYEIGRPDFDERDLLLLEEFAARGGRILLLYPAWVAAAYDKVSLDDIGFNRIARRYGVLITGDSSGTPFTIGAGFGQAETVLAVPGDPVFSRLIGRRHLIPVLSDDAGRTVAAASRRSDGAKLVVWGHNNLFDTPVLEAPASRATAAAIIEWLKSDD